MKLKEIIIILLAILIGFFTILLVLNLNDNYNKNHPCIEYKIVCEKSELRPSYPALMQYTEEVDCNKDYDRKVNKCIRRK